MIFTKIKELDAVLLNDGREGTVLETHEDGRVFMIEICDEEGRTIDMPFVKVEDISKVTYRA